MMIAVINYGAGNLPNVVRALEHVGAKVRITDDPDVVRTSPAVVLPGVGATLDTMNSLHALALTEAIAHVIADNRPFLGICVGMQILCTQSEEFGVHDCLKIIPGIVRRFPSGEKIPQIGWNQVEYTAHAANTPLFANIPNKSNFYFVHSYYCDLSDSTLIAGETEYGLRFPSVIVRGNMAATQFHPEKSGRCGLQVLQNFLTMCKET